MNNGRPSGKPGRLVEMVSMGPAARSGNKSFWSSGFSVGIWKLLVETRSSFCSHLPAWMYPVALPVVAVTREARDGVDGAVDPVFGGADRDSEEFGKGLEETRQEQSKEIEWFEVSLD